MYHSCHGNVPLEEFGEVVAALVAGDRLPRICPVVTMGALRGIVPVGEVGEKN